MFLISIFGKMWFGEEEWNRRKSGQYRPKQEWVEPYFDHPLDKMAWELRRDKFR